ncbi:MAG: IS21-like element helper ATPase IstB [Saccharofermentanales bacterium]|jgi:DNA replication protein DnaC
MQPSDSTSYQSLIENFRYLKLPKFEEKLSETLDRVQKRDLSVLEALHLLSNAEVDNKKQMSMLRSIRMAGFPHHKGLRDFDFAFQPSVNRGQIYDLATLGFIEHKENIVFLGSPGVGKTHLATALGIEAARHRISCYFIKANTLLTRLRKAKEENRLEASLRYYVRHRLLIIDELGFLPIQKGDEKLLFQVIDQRYEKKSTIVTTNVQFSDWGDLFEDPTIAHAILDRLLHHSHVLAIVGDSYRTKDLVGMRTQTDEEKPENFSPPRG